MYRVRSWIAGLRMKPTRSRGPADGLLEEIQAETLARHPEWQARLLEVEREPLRIGKNGRIRTAVNVRLRKKR